MSGTIAYNNSIVKEDQRMSHFVGIGLALGFLLPHTSTALLWVNPLLCLFYQCFRQNRGHYKYNWIVLVPIVVSLLINLPQGISTKSIISTFIILLYFFCFPIVGKVRVSNVYFYLILGFILITQVAYAYHITFIERILNTYYPLSEKEKSLAFQNEHITSDTLLEFRLGGIYHNSNQCARYLTFLLATFIINNNKKPFKQKLPYAIITYYAILLTGSRSGFVVASLVIIASLFVDKRVSLFWRIIVVFASIGVFLVLIIIGSDLFRGLNVVRGFNDSAKLKMDTFRYYVSTEDSPIKLLLGYVDVLRFDTSKAIYHVMNNFDSDYGDIIFSYGFIGFIAILVYYFTIFTKFKKESRSFFILLFWMYSSTIITSYRSCFVFMLLLSIIYSNSKDKSQFT